MVQIQRLQAEQEVKSSADKLYGLFTLNAPQLPKYIPELIQNVQVTGDEIHLGTVFVWNFTLDGCPVTAKERITAVDNKSRSITYSVLEGDIMNYYKSFDLKLDVTPKGDGKSLVKWAVEFEKADEDVPPPTGIMKCLEMMTTEVDVQLLKQAA